MGRRDDFHVRMLHEPLQSGGILSDLADDIDSTGRNSRAFQSIKLRGFCQAANQWLKAWPAFLTSLRSEAVERPVDSKLSLRNPAIGSARRKMDEGVLAVRRSHYSSATHET
jgi:hypothetical protein